jgi:hypothetical protein
VGWEHFTAAAVVADYRERVGQIELLHVLVDLEIRCIHEPRILMEG